MEQRLGVPHSQPHKPSPIPQRAKFLKKFNVGGKKKSPVAPKGERAGKRAGKEESRVQEGKEEEKGREGDMKMEVGEIEGGRDEEEEGEREGEEGEKGREGLGRETEVEKHQEAMETQPVKEELKVITSCCNHLVIIL